MTAGLFLVFAACLSWWYRLGTIAEGKNGCVGRREGGREARWGKWKFWSQRTRESSRWKSEVCCPSLWWMVVSLCLFWALSLSFQKALPMGLLCDLGWTWVSSEVFAFDFTRSPGITTSLGALFMFFYLCGGSWTTQGWWTWTLYPCEGSSMVVIGGDIYIPLARPHKKKKLHNFSVQVDRNFPYSPFHWGYMYPFVVLALQWSQFQFPASGGQGFVFCPHLDLKTVFATQSKMKCVPGLRTCRNR